MIQVNQEECCSLSSLMWIIVMMQIVEACKRVEEGCYPVPATLRATPAPAAAPGSWRLLQATPSQYVSGLVDRTSSEG